MIFQDATLGAFLGSLIALVIICWTPKRWWINRGKRIGFCFLILGITVPLFVYKIGPFLDRTKKEAEILIRDLNNLTRQSEEAACAKAGFSDPQIYWAGSPNDSIETGYWRLNCSDNTGLVHEVRAPKCHTRNPDGCR